MTAPQKTLESPDGLAGQSLGAAPCSAIVRVIGYTDREGMMWDMVCQSDALGTITVDPWVGCALEQMTDDEKRAIIGREFEMRDFWQHTSGVWLCHVFSPNKEMSDIPQIQNTNTPKREALGEAACSPLVAAFFWERAWSNAWRLLTTDDLRKCIIMGRWNAALQRYRSIHAIRCPVCAGAGGEWHWLTKQWNDCYRCQGLGKVEANAMPK